MFVDAVRCDQVLDIQVVSNRGRYRSSGGDCFRQLFELLNRRGRKYDTLGLDGQHCSFKQT